MDCGTTATAADPSVTLSAEGPSEITSKEDAQKIVTAEAADGSYSEYVINIHVIKDNELLIDSALYVITDPVDIDSLPGDFSEGEAEIGDETVRAARSKDGNFCLVCYANAEDEEDIRWYMLDEKTDNVYPAEITEIDGQRYIVISAGNELVYGNDGEQTGYFLIDPETGEIVFSLSGSGEQEKSKSSPVNIVIIAAAVVIVLLCGAFSCVVYRKYKTAGKKTGDSEKKYFRPYLTPDEEYMAKEDKTKTDKK